MNELNGSGTLFSVLRKWDRLPEARARVVIRLVRSISRVARHAVVASPSTFTAESVTATSCLWQVASGLRHLHERGVAHRDVKLENVLLAKHGDLSSCKLVRGAYRGTANLSRDPSDLHHQEVFHVSSILLLRWGLASPRESTHGDTHHRKRQHQSLKLQKPAKRTTGMTVPRQCQQSATAALPDDSCESSVGLLATSHRK